MSTFEQRRDSPLGVALFVGMFGGFAIVLTLGALHLWTIAVVVFVLWLIEMLAWALYLCRATA